MSADEHFAAIRRLEERVAALELEIYGPPAEELLDVFRTSQGLGAGRRAALQEYARLQKKEFYEKLPDLKAAAETQKAKYEAFMRERGFEP